MSPLGIVITILAIVLVVMFARYFFTDPYILQNIQNGKTTTTISSSDLATNGTGTSSNFAYSVWFYINDWNYRYGEPKAIFLRGTPSARGSGFVNGIDIANPAPAVILDPIENNVSVYLSCFPGATSSGTTTDNATPITQTHRCVVTNVPIQKWVNLTISTYGRTLDMYLDGKLVRTCLLPGVANISNTTGDLYVTPNGGFDGWTSKLQYFPNSLNPQEAWNIYTRGYSDWASLFNSYQIQVSLVQNGTTESSVTL